MARQKRLWSFFFFGLVPAAERARASRAISEESFLASGVLLSEIQDDAMEPTLRKGACRMGKGSAIAKCDNPAYPLTIELATDSSPAIRLLGRVV
jgi:hypothetical protein